MYPPSTLVKINDIHLMHESDAPRDATSPAHVKTKTYSHMMKNHAIQRVYKVRVIRELALS